jgi:formate/nitrite transporter FocA (FNT family)
MSEAVATKGGELGKLSSVHHTVLAALAGAYIGFGVAASCAVAGLLHAGFRHAHPGAVNLLFGLVFPIGLALCALNASSLFTSNLGYLFAAGLRRHARVIDIVRVLVISYGSNLAGALLLAQVVVWTGVFAKDSSFVHELASKKAHLGLVAAISRGVLCNWLVTLAINQTASQQPFKLQASARNQSDCRPTQSISIQASTAAASCGTLACIWPPIFAFVALGFEHCVANMFLLPLALMLGAPDNGFTIIDALLHNLLPVTLGNIIGAVVCVLSYRWTDMDLSSANDADNAV